MTTLAPNPFDLCLPAGYRQQVVPRTRDDCTQNTQAYWNNERIADCRRREYQFHVYRWAARLIRAYRLRSLVDVGSGPGWKLASLIAPVCQDITALDQPSAMDLARRFQIPATLGTIDLERPLPPTRAWDVVVCADVIEHLIDPMPLLEFLRSAAGQNGRILLSTPERDRLRGRECMGSDKPEHVREWARGEFLRFLAKAGFVVERSRLVPQDNTPVSAGRAGERLFRRGAAPRSLLACHAVLCRPR